MSKKDGPVILIEDDADDQQFVKEAYKNLRRDNEILVFDTGKKFLAYLDTTQEQPFVIFCNLNLHDLNGLGVRDTIANTPHLRNKSIPFVFLTTDTRNDSIRKAYEATVQGYLLKEDTFEKLQHNLQLVLDYWSLCLLPD